MGYGAKTWRAQQAGMIPEGPAAPDSTLKPARKRRFKSLLTRKLLGRFLLRRFLRVK
jgi:hypothetical protein